MSIVYNGTTLTDFIYDGTDCTTVIVNSTTVLFKEAYDEVLNSSIILNGLGMYVGIERAKQLENGILLLVVIRTNIVNGVTKYPRLIVKYDVVNKAIISYLGDETISNSYFNFTDDFIHLRLLGDNKTELYDYNFNLVHTLMLDTYYLDTYLGVSFSNFYILDGNTNLISTINKTGFNISNVLKTDTKVILNNSSDTTTSSRGAILIYDKLTMLETVKINYFGTQYYQNLGYSIGISSDNTVIYSFVTNHIPETILVKYDLLGNLISQSSILNIAGNINSIFIGDKAYIQSNGTVFVYNMSDFSFVYSFPVSGSIMVSSTDYISVSSSTVSNSYGIFQ